MKTTTWLKPSETDQLHGYGDFVWVVRKSSLNPELSFAHFDSKDKNKILFQDPYTVGDSEGLSIEYYYDVKFWANLDQPSAQLIDDLEMETN